MAGVQKAPSVSSVIYQKLPDGSPFEFNLIYDVIDERFEDSKKKIKFKNTERFLLQFSDAEKTNDVIWDRYECITAPIYETEQRFMKNPVHRFEAAEANAKELQSVGPLLDRSEKECYDAWHRVAWLICRLKKREQKLVMAAHYLCGAEWHLISAVYEHQPRWAKEKHRRAMANIEAQLQKDPDFVCTQENEEEIEELISEWKLDEAIFREYYAFEEPEAPFDDRRLVLGLE